VLGTSVVTPIQLSPVVVSVIDTLQGLPISPSNAPPMIILYPSTQAPSLNIGDHVTHRP
jgi:hypothetical protein